MMKKTVAISLILASLTLAGCGGAKTEKLIESGNEAFAQQDYATALTEYQQAAGENPELAEPIYNAANVQYRQGEFEQTSVTLQVALANADENLAAVGYFNLGNTLFQTEKYAEAVDAYAESLRLNPRDMDAKVNLELALQKLQQEQEEQQQDEQQDEQQQEQPEQEQENQDQQNEQDQQQENQDEQSQDEQNQDQQDQQNEQNQEQQNQNEQQEQDQQEQDQQSQGEQEQDQQEEDQAQQSQDEQNQGEQGEEQRDESEPQDSETEAGEEAEEQEKPQPGQPGDEPTNEEQNLTEMSLGELLDMEGLSEEQARQLLVAAAQGTETLQEYLQQMYVFPHSDVEQDW